jgi:alkanesulfonate monooxygenase SsuD/methylene tetrahydromethanopterin reductase-like flavin-dependent oxidoreductase (luciferase family)
MATEADKAGFHSVFMGESVSSNVFMDLTHVALETSRIELGVAVANVFSRTPTLIAMSAASLDRISNSRILLGLGTSTKPIIERVHGMEFQAPVKRTGEYIEIIRKAWSGDRFEHDGEFYSPNGGRIRVSPLGEEIPIGLAALGPMNLRLTGARGDIWLPHLIPRSSFSAVAEPMFESAHEAGRSPSDIDIYPYVPTAVAEDQAAATDLVRHHIASYVGPASPYRNIVAQAGYETEAETIHDAWQADDTEAAAAHVTDEMVRDIGIAATPDSIQEDLQKWADVDCVDVVMLNFPRSAGVETLLTTIEAVKDCL